MLDLGDQPRLEVTVTDATGSLVDAITLTLTITLPDQTTVTPTPVHDSVGKYHYDYLTVQAGRHVARWVATGSIPFGHTEVFDVEPAADPSLISLDDVKTQLRITTTTSDDELRSYILSASENIESAVGVCAARPFTDMCANYGLSLYLPRSPVLALTSLTPANTTVADVIALGDVFIDLASGEITRLDQSRFYGDYIAAYTAGRTIIPPSLRTACMLIVQHLWATRRGPAGVPAGGMDTVTLPGWGYAIPSRAAELLSPYRRKQAVFA